MLHLCFLLHTDVWAAPLMIKFQLSNKYEYLRPSWSVSVSQIWLLNRLIDPCGIAGNVKIWSQKSKTLILRCYPAEVDCGKRSTGMGPSWREIKIEAEQRGGGEKKERNNCRSLKTCLDVCICHFKDSFSIFLCCSCTVQSALEPVHLQTTTHSLPPCAALKLKVESIQLVHKCA